jgi:diguanylate cyclase (GGDEF)-like protein/PAS domain S-box-containing protein
MEAGCADAFFTFKHPPAHPELVRTRAFHSADARCMMNERIRLRVLILEDQALDAELIEKGLDAPGYVMEFTRVETEAQFRTALSARPDIVLSDYHLPQFSGLRALAILRESKSEIPFILISGGISEEEAVEVMRLGADDFLLKDRLGRLATAVTGAIERRQLRDIARQTEQRHRSTFEHAPIGITHTSLDGRFIEINPQACEILGYSREELLTRTFLDITHPDDRASSNAFREQLIADEGAGNVSREKRYIRSNQSMVWVTVSVALMRKPDGAPDYFVTMFRDISSRKSAEELFRATFDQAAVGIALTLPSGDYQTVNDCLCDMLGYSRVELLHKNAHDDVTHPDDRKASRQRTEELLRGDKQQVYAEKRYVRKDGGIIWCNVSISAVCGANGKSTHVIAVMQDITARKQAEALLEQTFEQAAVGIVRTDLDRRIIATNHKFCEMTGFSKEELLGTKLRQISHPDDQGRDAKERGRLVAGEIEHLQSERRYIRKDGRLIWVRRTTSLVRDIASGNAHYIFVIEDITARRVAEDSYRATFDNAPIGIMHSTADRKILHVNPKLCEILGYTREELLAMKTSDLLSPQSRESDRPKYLEPILKGDLPSFSSERPFIRKDGGIVWANRTVTLVRDIEGKPLYFLRIIEDISERKRAEDALTQERLMLRTVVDAIPDRIYVKDVEGRYILQNAANLKLRGIDQLENIVGKTVFDIFPPEQAQRIHEEDLAIINSGVPLIEREGRTHFGTGSESGGETRWHLTSKVPLRDAAGKIYGLVGVNRDITERKQSSERLAHLAHYDSVTGLPNRVLLHDRLGQTIAQARRNGWFVGVLFLDLDRFKLVNDTLGHAAGDLLLKQVALRLTQSLRPSDTVGRLSGDEFAVILSELMSPQNAGLVAQKLIDALRLPYNLDGNEVFVTASIGITLYPADSDNIETLIRDADAAMYGAKSAGRNNYQYYTAEMNQRATEKLRLETRLRHAIEREEFMLHYQPKVDVVSGKITGLEALLRWQSPDEGMVGPDQFIPLLEETGLIVQVGNWVTRKACAQIHAWREAGLAPVPIAVNLSARQLKQAGFGATLGRALAEFSVPAELIEIEITESSLMENPEQAIVVLTEIANLGVRMSADDFGTGYSSLSYLKRLPLDALKIDRSFVRDITSDPDDAAITRTVITLAHGLDLKVIAEGVETEEQLAFLGQNQCDEAQGYLFSRPLPVDACTRLLAQGNTLHPARVTATADDIPAVLLVDDDADHLMLTRILLQRDGHRVLETTSTRDAFELLATNRVRIIIADENMPGMSGVEFLRRAKLMYPDTMRIMFSGAGDFGTATAAINEGEVHKFFIKGKDEELLRREIRKKVWLTPH